MADNTVLNAGAGGDTIATDDVGGIKHQLVKVEFGALDTATLVTASVGLPTDPLDRVARDMGKIDVALLDQYTPIDVDTGGGTLNALPITWRAASTLGLEMGTATTPVRVDVTGTTTQPVSGTVTANAGSGTLAVSGPLTNTELRATAVPVSGTVTANPASGTITTVSTVTNLSQMGGVAIALDTGIRSTGTQRVTIATDDVVPASQSGTWTVQPGNTANTTAWKVDGSAVTQPVSIAAAVVANLEPLTTGGVTMSKVVSAATTNATSLKASAGKVYGIQVFNINAAARYLKLYNKASAPTVGSDTPVKTILIPGNTAGAGAVMDFPMGLGFSTGIAWALTTEITDAGTTGVAASEIVVNIDYK